MGHFIKNILPANFLDSPETTKSHRTQATIYQLHKDTISQKPRLSPLTTARKRNWSLLKEVKKLRKVGKLNKQA